MMTAQEEASDQAGLAGPIRSEAEFIVDDLSRVSAPRRSEDHAIQGYVAIFAQTYQARNPPLKEINKASVTSSQQAALVIIMWSLLHRGLAGVAIVSNLHPLTGNRLHDIFIILRPEANPGSIKIPLL